MCVAATTDGEVKALVRSGVATGLVFRAPPCAFDDDDDDDATNAEDGRDVDARWFSDDFILARRYSYGQRGLGIQENRMLIDTGHDHN